MRCLIRCDLGSQYGLGRAVRCRALAQALAARGMQVYFVGPALSQRGFFAPFRLYTDWYEAMGACWWDRLVVDVPTDSCAAPETLLPPSTQQRRLVLVDQIPLQGMDPACILFPNAHQSPATLARLEVDFPGRVLHGWDCVMLAPEVTQQATVPYRERQYRPIVFCAGGSDPDGALRQMYHWAAYLDIDAPKVFLTGKYATDVPVASDGHGARGGMWVEPFERRWLRSAPLVVGFLGQTVYECLWFQSPVLTFARTEDDAQAIQRLGSAGVNPVPSDMLPLWSRMTQERFCAMVEAYMDGDVRADMHAASAGLMDGRGTERVAEAIMELGREHRV